MLKRTHHCGQLRLEHDTQTVVLSGWVNSYRDHGNLVFIDLRDRNGLVQLVFDPEADSLSHKTARELRCEWVIAAKGLQVLNASKTPPFEIDAADQVNEELRLQYRYMDLRRQAMLNKLAVRHRVTKIVRDYYDEHGFWEIETPMLGKSTPEGARDFLVPSRLCQANRRNCLSRY
jgi:aspartyl-tRNA synthetase